MGDLGLLGQAGLDDLTTHVMRIFLQLTCEDVFGEPISLETNLSDRVTSCSKTFLKD